MPLNLPPAPDLTDLSRNQEVQSLSTFLRRVREELISQVSQVGESEEVTEPREGDMFMEEEAGGTVCLKVFFKGSYRRFTPS